MATSIQETRIHSLSSQFAVLQNETKKSIVSFSLPGILSPTEDVQGAVIRFRSAVIPNVFPNVNNASLSFVYGFNGSTIQYTVNIEKGYYDVYTLVDAINTALLAIVPPFGGVSSLRALIEFDYSFERNSVMVRAGAYPTLVTLVWKPTSFSDQLGFVLATLGTEIVQNVLFFATYGPKLAGVTEIFVLCADVSSDNYSTELDNSYLVAIPITKGFLGTVHWQNTSPNGFTIPPNLNLDALTFYLLDSNGEYLDFNNYDWTIKMEVILSKSQTPTAIDESFNTSIQKILQQLEAANAQDGYPTAQKKSTEKEYQMFVELEKTDALRQVEVALQEIAEESQKKTPTENE